MSVKNIKQMHIFIEALNDLSETINHFHFAAYTPTNPSSLWFLSPLILRIFIPEDQRWAHNNNICGSNTDAYYFSPPPNQKLLDCLAPLD